MALESIGGTHLELENAIKLPIRGRSTEVGKTIGRLWCVDLGRFSGWEWGKAYQEGPRTNASGENINEDKLRHQRRPAGGDALLFGFHWLCWWSSFFKQERHHCIERSEKELCKKQSLHNLSSYAGLSLPSSAPAKDLLKQSVDFDF